MRGSFNLCSTSALNQSECTTGFFKLKKKKKEIWYDRHVYSWHSLIMRKRRLLFHSVAHSVNISAQLHSFPQSTDGCAFLESTTLRLNVPSDNHCAQPLTSDLQCNISGINCIFHVLRLNLRVQDCVLMFDTLVPVFTHIKKCALWGEKRERASSWLHTETFWAQIQSSH